MNKNMPLKMQVTNETFTAITIKINYIYNLDFIEIFSMKILKYLMKINDIYTC